MWKINVSNRKSVSRMSVKDAWIIILIACMVLPVFVSCTDDDDQYTTGVWYRRSDFDGVVRSDAAAFTIGNSGYICGGYNTTKVRLNDLWVYDMNGNYWTQCASMPDEAGLRNSAVGFSIGTKGYITTGFDGQNYLKDTWEYNPATNSWMQKDDYAGSGRMYALSFSIGSYGYVGTGYNENTQKDFYRFNPDAVSGSQWEIVNGFGGNKRSAATAFVINDIAYICTGTNNGTYVYDFWSFNPATDTWKQLRDISNTSDDDYDDDYNSIVRAYATSFVFDDRAYLVTGENGAALSNYWIYDPSTDLWEGEDLTPFEGSTRVSAVAFSTGLKGFVATGRSGSSRFDDTWELSPYELEEK